jgi:hypothetical protein
MLKRVCMSKCIYCGAETKLQVLGRPICVDCVKEIEDGKKPSRPALTSKSKFS